MTIAKERQSKQMQRVKCSKRKFDPRQPSGGKSAGRAFLHFASFVHDKIRRRAKWHLRVDKLHAELLKLAREDVHSKRRSEKTARV